MGNERCLSIALGASCNWTGLIGTSIKEPNLGIRQISDDRAAAVSLPN